MCKVHSCSELNSRELTHNIFEMYTGTSGFQKDGLCPGINLLHSKYRVLIFKNLLRETPLQVGHRRVQWELERLDTHLCRKFLGRPTPLVRLSPMARNHPYFLLFGPWL